MPFEKVADMNELHATPSSPITGTPNCRKIAEIAADKLIERWHNAFGIDIAAEFSGVSAITLWECPDTRVQFYTPDDVTGSAELYQQLQKQEWYYGIDKWEHRVSAENLEVGDNVIEIGCGRGEFIRRCLDRGVNIRGIELNPDAVEVAARAALPVTLESAKDALLRHGPIFDVVCCFQVLEHVPKPAEFIRECGALLKTNGKLILAVPNRESALLRELVLLDMPPHHMSRWNRDALAATGEKLGLRTLKTRFEPLTPHHVRELAEIVSRPFKRAPISRFKLAVPLQKCLVALGAFGMQRLIRGHTIWTILQKTRSFDPAGNLIASK